MSPPIRPAGHEKALQAALSMGALQVSLSLLEKVFPTRFPTRY